MKRFKTFLGHKLRHLAAIMCGGLVACGAHSANAHPHVFVDGGIDFVFGGSSTLRALELTWLYDEFETLYILSQLGLNLNEQGDVNEDDRRKLVDALSMWPDDFDGSAHLTLRDQVVSLDWPKNVDADLVDGRLKLTFLRHLSEPLDMRDQRADVAFYESTYFFAFKITNTPKLKDLDAACSAEIIPFKPEPNDASLLAQLAALNREETPQDENVGILFADRIALQCE